MFGMRKGPGDFYNIYLVKADVQGNFEWDKTYYESWYNYGKSVKQTPDGGYILLGNTLAYSPTGDQEFYLVKTDTLGNVEWKSTYGIADRNIAGYSIELTSDGGFALLGRAHNDPLTQSDMYLVKTDSLGNKLWENIYGGTGLDEGHSVEQTPDGGFILGGRSNSSGSNGIYLVKTDSSGTELWSNNFSSIINFSQGVAGPTATQSFDALGNPDGYALVGTSMTGRDFLLIKTDIDGNLNP